MSEYTTVTIQKSALASLQESIVIATQVLQRKLTAYQFKIKQFEETYQMDTPTFVSRFNDGALGDQKEWFKWDHYASVIAMLKVKLTDLEGIRYGS